MNKEEIQEYLKRVDELELRLEEEDKDTLQWLIFGYNECAKLLYEKEQELDRLNKVLKYLEKHFQEREEYENAELVRQLKEVNVEWLENALGGKE